MITFFYNEEKDISVYLKTVSEKFEVAARRHPFKFEIVMVNDGSTDRSEKIVLDFMAQNPHIDIRLHSYPDNRGIGHALVEGVRRCRYDYIFWNDVDMHFDILDIDKILYHLQPDTIVVAYKNNIKYKELGPWLISRVNYYLLKSTFFWRIKDFQFVQFYPEQYIKNVPIISRSSLIPCELLTRSRRYRYRLHQVPLHYYSPGHDRQSKCMNLKNIYFTLRDLIKLRLSLLGTGLIRGLSAPKVSSAPVSKRVETPGPEDPVLG
jgi:glycosyltransferase involved in cell wall biosynthesis